MPELANFSAVLEGKMRATGDAPAHGICTPAYAGLIEQVERVAVALKVGAIYGHPPPPTCNATEIE